MRSSVASFDDDLEGINDILNYKSNKAEKEHEELMPEKSEEPQLINEPKLEEVSKIE